MPVSQNLTPNRIYMFNKNTKVIIGSCLVLYAMENEYSGESRNKNGEVKKC